MYSIDPTTKVGQRIQSVDITTAVAAIEERYSGDDAESKTYHNLVKYIGEGLKSVQKVDQISRDALTVATQSVTEADHIRRDALTVATQSVAEADLNLYIANAKLSPIDYPRRTKETAFVVYAATDCTTPSTYDWLAKCDNVTPRYHELAIGILLGVLKNGDKPATHISFSSGVPVIH